MPNAEKRVMVSGRVDTIHNRTTPLKLLARTTRWSQSPSGENNRCQAETSGHHSRIERQLQSAAPPCHEGPWGGRMEAGEVSPSNDSGEPNSHVPALMDPKCKPNANSLKINSAATTPKGYGEVVWSGWRNRLPLALVHPTAMPELMDPRR